MGAATPAVADGKSDLAQARAATAKYHDIDRALAAGYVQRSPCEQGQGHHYVRDDLAFDAALDPTQPEVLLYAPNASGKLKLVGVEYVRFYPGMPDPTNPPYQRDPMGPALFGTQFHGPMAGHAPGMPVHHELHVWLWAHSPEGMFSDHNSRIVCPD
jgi:hypothetical protein